MLHPCFLRKQTLDALVKDPTVFHITAAARRGARARSATEGRGRAMGETGSGRGPPALRWAVLTWQVGSGRGAGGRKGRNTRSSGHRRDADAFLLV